MSLILVKKPERSVNGHLSKWNAVHHPVEFQLQRKDQNVIMKYKYTSTGATVRIKVQGAVPSDVAVGQSIYYKGGTQGYTWTITAISGNIIVTDGTISGTVYGGFVNYVGARLKYFIETKVYIVDTSSAYKYLGTIRNKADLKGLAKTNIQEWLKSIAVYDDKFKYDAINKAIAGEGGKFTVRCQEVYNGVSQGFGGYLQLGYWVNASKQIQEIYGSNMGEFCPTYDNSRDPKAKFLSVFDQPTYFPGYPFSIAFIYSDNMMNYQLMRKESTKDINGTEINLSSADLNAGQRFFVNRLMLEESYTSNVDGLQVWLETGSPIVASPIELSSGYSDGTIFSPLNPVDIVKIEKNIR
jgi:hypothetical protein